MYPPPQPPPSPNRLLWWVLCGAVALVVIAVAVAGIAIVRGVGGGAPLGVQATSTKPDGGGCGLPGSNAATPISDRVSAGPLSFPVSAAPGWTKQDTPTYAQSALAQGIEEELAGQRWQSHAEVGLTTFSPRVSIHEAARRMIPCIAAGSVYTRYRPRIEALTVPESIMVDGVPAARVSARLLVDEPGAAVAGDVITVVVIDSAPQAYFESDTPIGYEPQAAVARQIFDQLKVARDV